MASARLTPLLEALTKTGADELRLIAGERIHIWKRGVRQDIGKEPLKFSNIEPLALDELPAADVRALGTTPQTTRVDHAGVGYFVTFAKNSGGVTVAVRPENFGPPLAITTEKPGAPGEAPSASTMAAAPPKATDARAQAPLPKTPEVAVAEKRPPAAASAEKPGERVVEPVPPAAPAPPVAPSPPAAPSPTAAPSPPVSAVSLVDREGPRKEPSSQSKLRAASVAPPIELAASPGAGGTGRAIDELLHEMIGRKASDLHLSTGVHPVIRVHGSMEFLTGRPVLTSDEVYNLLKPAMNERSSNDFETKNDADFAYEVKGLARFRVNMFRDRKGVGAVLRQIPIEIIPADKLGLPKAALDLCFLSKGLVVVTGPTGSGKSTTLAALIDHVNKNRSDHIITIEDPVEFVHNNNKCLINQREVGQHTSSFKNALRAALREDPDIVLVGEMRDLETVAIAIETAETGHLVFGTLHTTTAVSTVDRIIDQFPTDQQAQIRVMLSESLKGVIAQVLCKKQGGGRVAALEILLVNTAVAALIRDGKTFQIPSIMQTQKGIGMLTMNDSLLHLVQTKQVSSMDAYIKAVDKAGLLMMFKNAGVPSPV